MDLNPLFTGATLFRPAGASGGELKLFEQANIKLVHGWLVDPDSPEHPALSRTKDYDSSVNLIVQADHVSNGKLVVADVVTPKMESSHAGGSGSGGSGAAGSSGAAGGSSAAGNSSAAGSSNAAGSSSVSGSSSAAAGNISSAGGSSAAYPSSAGLSPEHQKMVEDGA